jgi:hypothetical protein
MPVSTREAMNSRFVTGVSGFTGGSDLTGAAVLGLDFCFWYQADLAAPGTGSPQVKHSKSVLVIIPLQALHRVMPN